MLIEFSGFLARFALVWLLVASCIPSAWSAGAAAGRLTASDALAATGRTARIESGQKFFAGAAYAGSQSCIDCHATQHADWKTTWHAKMSGGPVRTSFWAISTTGPFG